ncbi:hypothetical protein C3L33_12697, partial [Rhododendron williamsianum]
MEDSIAGFDYRANLGVCIIFMQLVFTFVCRCIMQDELMAWWCATQKSGGKVPSEDHLRSKLQERKMLGF